MLKLVIASSAWIAERLFTVPGGVAHCEFVELLTPVTVYVCAHAETDVRATNAAATKEPRIRANLITHLRPWI
jgi:hypothetical protein